MGDYNYDRFTASRYDLLNFPGPQVGDALTDITLTDFDGKEVSLSQFRGRRLVIETGSVTCPMYVKNVKSMQDVAAEHRDTSFVVMYVREAHPGSSIEAHENIDDKRSCAHRLQGTVNENRVVLVDDIDGTAHRALGSFPNLTYIVDEAGVITWRIAWADTKTIAAVLDGSASSEQLSRDLVPPTRPTPWLAAQVLWRAGPIALFDFVKSLPALMRSHGRVKRANEG